MEQGHWERGRSLTQGQIIACGLCGERNKDTVWEQGCNKEVVGFMDGRFHLDQAFVELGHQTELIGQKGGSG